MNEETKLVLQRLRKRVEETTTRYDTRYGFRIVNLPPCQCGACQACEARIVLALIDNKGG